MILQTGTFTYQKFAEILSDPEVSSKPVCPLLFTACTIKQCRWQIRRETGLKASTKLHTTNKSCYSLGHLALTPWLELSKVAGMGDSTVKCSA